MIIVNNIQEHAGFLFAHCIKHLVPVCHFGPMLHIQPIFFLFLCVLCFIFCHVHMFVSCFLHVHMSLVIHICIEGQNWS